MTDSNESVLARPMLKASKSFSKVATVLGLSLMLTIPVAGCSVSDSTKESGKTMICAAGGSVVSQIRTGGAMAKFVAGVVRDNSEGETKQLAESVANGSGDTVAANKLADYVEDLCS